MAAPNYSTDLTSLAIANETADSGTWAELSGHTGGSSAGDETDYYINNTSCISQQLGTKTGTQAGIQYDHGAAVSLAANEVMTFWQVLLAGNAIDTFANGGMRMYIGSSAGNVKIFKTNGSDYNRNPYGGWINVAVDPTNTGDYTNEGSPSGTDWRLVGSGPNLTSAVSKGYMHGVGKIQYGRCEAIFTDGDLANGYATFDGFATQNDSQNNRWGLISLQGGSYIWKGLQSIGTTATSVDFRDANRNIIIDQTPKTYAAFNRIEINNASSNVEWTAINISAPTEIPSGESAILSKGELEVIDNATVSMTNCTFTDMSTFIFNGGTNANTLTNTTFRRCGQVTQSGGTFNSCTFDESPAAVTLVADDMSKLDACTFNSDGSNHAVNLGTITTNSSVGWNHTTSGYAGVNGSTGNETILVNVNNGVTLTVNVTGGTTPTYYNTGTGTVTVASSATLTINNLFAGTEVRVHRASDGVELDGIEDATTVDPDNAGRYKFDFAYTVNEAVYIVILNLDYIFQRIDYTLDGTDQKLQVSQQVERNYYNP